MKSAKRIEKIISKFCDAVKASITTSSEMDDKVLENAFTAYEESKRQSAQAQPKAGRIIMKSRMTRFTAATAAIIVVLAVMHFTGGPDMAGVAWGELADRVGLIQTCIFRGYTRTIVDPNSDKVMEGEMEVFVSSEYGFRSNVYVDGKAQMMQYALLKDKAIISVMPGQKRYMKMILTDEHLEKMRTQGSDPREMVKQLMSGEYVELGRDIIDGIEVEGIETTDPKASGGQFDDYVGRLWVDVETQLPVRMEIEMTMEAADKTIQMSMVMEDFQWDVEIAPEVFEPNIPEDYTSMGEMPIPEQNEASAVEGLRLYAEISDGNYPASMSMMKISAEMGKIMGGKLARGYDPNDKPTEEQRDAMMQDMMSTTMTVGGACMFYAKLVQEDKDAVYYGDRVTTADPDAVLMRWKVSDDLYRVIFGDLTIENVTAEQLGELEAALLQQ